MRSLENLSSVSPQFCSGRPIWPLFPLAAHIRVRADITAAQSEQKEKRRFTMRNFMTRLFFGLAMLAAPTLSTFSGSSAFAAQAAVVPGQLAPDFEITLANGRSGHLSDFRGRVVVLDFWASGCS